MSNAGYNRAINDEPKIIADEDGQGRPFTRPVYPDSDLQFYVDQGNTPIGRAGEIQAADLPPIMLYWHAAAEILALRRALRKSSEAGPGDMGIDVDLDSLLPE